MVVQVLVAEAQPEDALSQQGLDAVLDPSRTAMVHEALGETRHDAGPRVRLRQQRCTAVTRHPSAIERGFYLATPKPLEFQNVVEVESPSGLRDLSVTT